MTEKLVLEEFKQAHASIRQREVAMSQMLTVTTTASVTLLAATSAFVFQATKATSATYCFLILLPIPLLNFMLSLITSHRCDIYRMRYYLTVFHEELYGGAEWGLRLFRFRELRKGESQDAVTLVFWALFVMSSLLFVAALQHNGSHVFFNSLILIPLGAWMTHQNSKFHQDRRSMKAVWVEVMREQSAESGLSAATFQPKVWSAA